MIYKNTIDDTLASDETTEDIIDQAALMGYDDLGNPEQLSGFIKNIIQRIGARIKERREAKKASGQASQGWGVSSPAGSISYTPGASEPVQVLSPIQSQSALPATLEAGMGDMFKNPYVLIGGAALIFFLLMQKK